MSHPLRVVLVGLASLAGLGAVGGCVDARLLPAPDGGPQAAATSPGCRPGPAPAEGMAAGGTCTLERPPSRPVGCTDDGAGDVVYLALKNPRFGERGTGYDLDGYCSGAEGTPNGCTPNADYAPPDTTGGVDNIFGTSILEGLRLIDGTLEERAVAAQEAGKLNVMLAIRGWNGETRDPQVEVVMATSSATRPSPPAWDGADVFAPAASFYEAGDPDRPLVRDDNAYVADGILVAELPDRIPLGFDTGVQRIELRLAQARLTLPLLGPDAFTDVVLSGRWPQTEARAAAPLLGLCAESTDPLILTQRDAYLNAIDRFADVREAESDTDPALSCDALSFAVHLDGFPIQWGTPTPLEASANLCP